jgi:putative colanic acid biosynthesis glycosyltransferase
MSAAGPIRLSIVVACKNPGPRLHAALESIWTQHCEGVEVIVVDGGSTDGSREWLTAQRERLAGFVSEPDAGVYDAMKKGVAAARGDWVLFLGADDRLAGDMVLSEALNWAKETEAGVIAGEIIYEDGRIYRLRSRVNPTARNFVHHQAAFYRRSLFAENGGFDPSLAVMADYDFNVRLWKNRVRFKPIPLRIATCGVRGLSDSGGWQGYGEEITVRHRYFPAWRCGVWDIFSVLRWLRKKVIRSFVRPHHV